MIPGPPRSVTLAVVRSRPRIARSLLVLGALAAVLAATLASAGSRAGAARGPGIVVRLPGASGGGAGAPTFVSADEIAAQADIAPTGYTLRRARGDAGRPVTLSGLSVRKLVTLAGGDPDTIAFVEIGTPDGPAVFLDRADLADPPPFPEGPALVYVRGTTTHFFRPVRDDRDVNAPDHVLSEPGGSLALSGHTGSLLSVRARADDTTVKPHAVVSFTARATGAKPHEKLTYLWRFGDGRRATGASVSHAFATLGEYFATVTVTGDLDSAGISPSLRIRVGDVPAGPGGGGGATGPSGPSGATGNGGTSPGAGANSGNGGGAYGYGGGGYGGATTPPIAPLPSPPTAAPNPSPAPSRSPSPGRGAPIPVGEPVDGVLVAVAGAAGAQAQGGPAGSSGSRPSRATRRDTSRTRFEVPIVGGAAALLILFGAAAELWAQRGRRPIRAMIPLLR